MAAQARAVDGAPALQDLPGHARAVQLRFQPPGLGRVQGHGPHQRVAQGVAAARTRGQHVLAHEVHDLRPHGPVGGQLAPVHGHVARALAVHLLFQDVLAGHGREVPGLRLDQAAHARIDEEHLFRPEGVVREVLVEDAAQVVLLLLRRRHVVEVRGVVVGLRGPDEGVAALPGQDEDDAPVGQDEEVALVVHAVADDQVDAAHVDQFGGRCRPWRRGPGPEPRGRRR